MRRKARLKAKGVAAFAVLERLTFTAAKAVLVSHRSIVRLDMTHALRGPSATQPTVSDDACGSSAICDPPLTVATETRWRSSFCLTQAVRVASEHHSVIKATAISLYNQLRSEVVSA